MTRNSNFFRYLDEDLDFMETRGIREWIFELAATKYKLDQPTKETVLELYKNNEAFYKEINSYIVTNLSNIDELRCLSNKENGKHIKNIISQRAEDLISDVKDIQINQKFDDLTFLAVLANFCKDYVLMHESSLEDLPFCSNITDDMELLKQLCDAIGINLDQLTTPRTAEDAALVNGKYGVKLKEEIEDKYKSIRNNFHSSVYESNHKSFIQSMGQSLDNIFEVFSKACSNKNGLKHVEKYYGKIETDISAILSAGDTLAKAKNICSLFYDYNSGQYISRRIDDNLKFTSENISAHLQAMPIDENKFNNAVAKLIEKPIEPVITNKYTDRAKISQYKGDMRNYERDTAHLKKGYDEFRSLSKKGNHSELYSYFDKNTGTVPRWFLEYVIEGKSRSGFMHGADVLTGYGKFKDQQLYSKLNDKDKQIVALAVVYSLCNISKQITPLMKKLQSIVNNFRDNFEKYSEDFGYAVYDGFNEIKDSILNDSNKTAKAVEQIIISK